MSRAGWYLHKSGKKHDEWRHPERRERIIIPRHGAEEAKSGIAVKILKQAGLK